MYAQTFCAQVAHRLGEPIRLVRGRGFQPLRLSRKTAQPSLSAVDCPFCGQQVLVVPSSEAVEADCRGCDTVFFADAEEVYQVTLGDAEQPQPRRFLHENR
jgi:hypothetical protein